MSSIRVSGKNTGISQACLSKTRVFESLQLNKMLLQDTRQPHHKKWQQQTRKNHAWGIVDVVDLHFPAEVCTSTHYFDLLFFTCATDNFHFNFVSRNNKLQRRDQLLGLSWKQAYAYCFVVTDIHCFDGMLLFFLTRPITLNSWSACLFHYVFQTNLHNLSLVVSVQQEDKTTLVRISVHISKSRSVWQIFPIESGPNIAARTCFGNVHVLHILHTQFKIPVQPFESCHVCFCDAFKKYLYRRCLSRQIANAPPPLWGPLGGPFRGAL